MYKNYIMPKKLGLIAQLLPKIGFKHFTAAYRGSPPPAVFHNQMKKNTAAKSASAGGFSYKSMQTLREPSPQAISVSSLSSSLTKVTSVMLSHKEEARFSALYILIYL